MLEGVLSSLCLSFVFVFFFFRERVSGERDGTM